MAYSTPGSLRRSSGGVPRIRPPKSCSILRRTRTEIRIPWLRDYTSTFETAENRPVTALPAYRPQEMPISMRCTLRFGSTWEHAGKRAECDIPPAGNQMRTKTKKRTRCFSSAAEDLLAAKVLSRLGWHSSSPSMFHTSSASQGVQTGNRGIETCSQSH